VSAVSASEAESNAPSPVAVAHAQIPVPLHYGYARAAPARKVYFPPSPSAALAREGLRVPAQDPFSTPFDDDAGIQPDFSFIPLSRAKDAGAKFVPAGRAF